MKKENNRVAISEAFEVAGYPLYGFKEVHLRAMTSIEEKKRISATGFDIIPRLIQDCCVDEGFNVYDLKPFDVLRLMYGLRIVTYGPEYNVSIPCPGCKSQFDYSANLDELEIKYVPEDFEEPFTIGPLPDSKDILECKIISIKDYLDITAEAKKIKKRSPDAINPEFDLNYIKKIVSINGERVMPFELQSYVENLSLKDLRYFDCKYDECVGDYGLDTKITVTCPNCGEEFQTILPYTSEFFRPKF